MDRTLARNFLIFTGLMLACVGGLFFALTRTGADIQHTREQLAHHNETLFASQQLSALVESMLNEQRGYIITGQKPFLEEYEKQKNAMSQQIAKLSEMLRDDPSQQSRLDEMRGYFSGLAFKLEERARSTKPLNTSAESTASLQTIDGLRRNINRLNADIRTEEMEMRTSRTEEMQSMRNKYYGTLIIGGLMCLVVMLLLNGFLLHAHTKRTSAEKFLKESEDRFALATNGANDGIFDWNLDTGAMFYSRPFFSMLGYDRPSHVSHVDDFKKLLHPEDAEKVWAYVDQYLRGEVSEYSSVFRMRHATGRWVWINARAKAIYDDNGRPYRMVGAHTDITYLKEQQRRLEEAKQAAENASRAKTDFLAHMSHEIRTPLTAISGIAEILERQKEKLNDKQRQLVSTLMTSTSSLKDLINDVLDFSKIESGEISLESKDFQLAELFHQVISITALHAGEKGLKFMVDYDAVENATFRGDPLRIRQILINLIGNAIKFTDSGRIDVVASLDPGSTENMALVRVDVRDTGIGVNPAVVDTIFERFKQGDSSVSRKYGGTGLGLPISRNLARLMGGDITVQSEQDKGSCFTLTLPLDIIATAPLALPAPNQQAPARAATVTASQQPLPVAVRHPSASMAGSENRVLMVEDYEGNIVVVSYFLEDMNLPFDVARSGRQALEQWGQRHYDIILMDIQMPEMDGFTATRKIREFEAKNNLPRTPIIGMTAHALVGDRDKCIEAGMDTYLPKPIVEADLRAAILQHLQNKKAA